MLTITGIISGSYALVQIPEGISCYIPYVVISVLTLPVGIYLCLLVIKPMQYFVKSQNMSGEEKVIENIKKYIRHSRKSRISVAIFKFVLIASMLIGIIIFEIIFTKEISTENMELVGLVHLIVFRYVTLFATGALLVELSNEITGFTRNKYKLTVNMWERIQELEKEVTGLKACTQVDGQQIADVDGGDSASGAG